MKIPLLRSFAALVLGIVASPACTAAPLGWYTGLAWFAGVSAGQAKAHFNASGVDRIFATEGLTASSTLDNVHTGWKLWGGYRFNPNFSLEGGFVDLGEFSFNSVISAPAPGTAGGKVKAKNGVFIDAVGHYPLPANFSIFGRLGFYNIKTELNATAVVAGRSIPFSRDHKGTGYNFGAGIEYKFMPDIAARLEWNRFDKVGDRNSTGEANIDLLSIGLIYQF